MAAATSTRAATGYAFDIRQLDPKGLQDSLRLSGLRFGFGEVDQIPPWLVHTTNYYGGVALGAFSEERLIAYSFAFPGFKHGRPFLLSCGLAVDPEFESQGVGQALKLAQRERAREVGYDTIRWTTTPLGSRSLYLYLNKLGARLIRYHENMYADVFGATFPDEVEIEWRIRCPDPLQTDAHANSPTEPTSLGRIQQQLRRLTRVCDPGQDPSEDAYHVEIPWDRELLRTQDLSAARKWSADVRAAMQVLLKTGYVGTEVRLVRSERRSFVRFDRVQPDQLR